MTMVICTLHYDIFEYLLTDNQIILQFKSTLLPKQLLAHNSNDKITVKYQINLRKEIQRTLGSATQSDLPI